MVSKQLAFISSRHNYGNNASMLSSVDYVAACILRGLWMMTPCVELVPVFVHALQSTATLKNSLLFDVR